MLNHKPHNTMNSNAQIRKTAAGEPAFRLRRPRRASPEYVARFMKNSLWRLACVNMESWAHT